MLGRTIRLVALLVVSACLPGCFVFCALCNAPLPRSPAKGDRDTPEAAVAWLVDAFRRDAVLDIYESLHEDFKAENGGFSANDFNAAYAKYRDDFEADARNLADARRTVSSPDARGA